MALRKLLRTLQSEFHVLKFAKDSFGHHARHILRRPSDPDFGALRFLPDALPGCYLDIGANRGQSIEAIRLFKPQARIHCFEANPGLATMLQSRHRLNPRISVHPYGLAEAVKTQVLYTPVYKGLAYDGLASLNRDSAATWLSPDTLYAFRPQRLELRSTSCHTARLDDEGLDPIFIKIDVQGLEYEVILGGLGTIRRFEPLLMIEDLSHSPRLQTLLHDMGYRQYRFNPRGLYRADDPTVVNFLLMTPTRARTVILV